MLAGVNNPGRPCCLTKACYPRVCWREVTPAGMILCMSATAASARFTLPRAVWLSAIGVVAPLLGAITAEYIAIERSLTRYRFEAARVGSECGSQPPPTLLLTRLGALMQCVRTEPKTGLDDGQLQAMQTRRRALPVDGQSVPVGAGVGAQRQS